MGLIRKAIVLGGIIWALPSAPPDATQGTGAQASLQSQSFAAVQAAAGTMADLQGFCARQPQACVAGQYLAYTFEAKAKYLVHAAYQWSAPQTDSKATQVADQTVDEQNAAEQPATVQPVKVAKANIPALRTTTLNDTRPRSIEDLLRGSQQ